MFPELMSLQDRGAPSCSCSVMPMYARICKSTRRVYPCFAYETKLGI